MSPPPAEPRAALWRALQSAIAAARKRLAIDGEVDLAPLEHGLDAFAQAEHRPPAGPEEEAALVALLDELEAFATELAAERDRLRGDLARLDQAGRAQRGYAATSAG